MDINNESNVGTQYGKIDAVVECIIFIGVSHHIHDESRVVCSAFKMICRSHKFLIIIIFIEYVVLEIRRNKYRFFSSHISLPFTQGQWKKKTTCWRQPMPKYNKAFIIFTWFVFSFDLCRTFLAASQFFRTIRLFNQEIDQKKKFEKEATVTEASYFNCAWRRYLQLYRQKKYH